MYVRGFQKRTASEDAPPKIAVVTMGCSKNLVDSEVLLGRLKAGKVQLAEDVSSADIAVINTCGFIASAKQESVDAIVEAVELKRQGKLRRVVVMGCLSERYKEELRAEIPEVDAYFGANRMHEVADDLGSHLKHELVGERVLTTPSHFAYVKISEGCDHPCSFCAIPLMRGKHVTKPADLVISEAETLARGGVRELILIGQDTTYYGVDEDGTRKLPALMRRLIKIEGPEWIRLMYAYPSRFPLELLDVIADSPKMCKYIDMPVQHSSDAMLKSMRRGISSRAQRELIASIKERVPDIAFRTTLIVGYPGESEADFRDLCDFVREMRFNRLGVFTYSHEEGTASHAYEDKVPDEVKEERRGILMEIQRAISAELNASLVGSVKKVLIDRLEGEFAIGRTEWDAPEIDQEVYINRASGAGLEPGTFVQARIVDHVEYDLYAECA